MQKGPFGGHLVVPHHHHQSRANFKFDPTSGLDHIAQGNLQPSTKHVQGHGCNSLTIPIFD